MELDIKKIISKSGMPILEINGFLTNSKYNPKKEVENYIEQHYKPNKLNIVFGYGMGYLIDALEKRIMLNEKILVVDPLLEKDLLPISQKEKSRHSNIIGIKLDNIHELRSYIGQIDSNVRTQFNVFCTHNYDKIFPNEYKELLSVIKEIQYFHMISDNTIISSSEKWQENIIMNLVNLNRDTSLINLKNQYNKPVVIASSGPSLMKQLDTLKKYKDRIILISAGSTTNVLLKNNVVPDFIVSIDGNEANYNHFKDLRLTNSRLIYLLESHFKIRDSFEQQAFICSSLSNKSLNRYLQSSLKLKVPCLYSSFTVATLSFSVALYISTGPVALIGQDLAFTDNLTHSLGHNHSNFIDETNEDYIKIPGYFNEEVLTNQVMNGMRLGFEQMVSGQNIVNPFYNCTEGGAKIKGFQQMAFEEFCVKFVKASSDSIIPEEFETCFDDKKLISKFNSELSGAKECIELYSEALKLISKDKSIKQFKSSTLKKLNELDRKIKIILDDLSADTILTPVALYVKRGFLNKENETDYQKFKRVKEQNIVLYKESRKALKIYANYIEKSLEKMKEVQGV